MKKSFMLTNQWKTLLLLVCFLTTSNLFAQLMTETFDVTSLPANWLNTNNTGSTSANMSWKFSGSLGYNMSGTTDNTGNGGSFAWVDGSSPTSGEVTLETDSITVGSSQFLELSFWLKRYGQGMATWNSFTVDFYDGFTWHNDEFVHTSDTKDQTWENFKVPLAQYTLGNKVLFRFNVDKVGTPNTYQDDVALDDISVDTMPNIDAYPSALISPSFPSCGADSIVEVEISSYGGFDVTSLNVGWSVNGVVQTPGSFTGTLPVLGKDTVSLGVYSGGLTDGDVIQYWTYNVNGAGNDDNVNNDTATFTYKNGLSGTYVLGTTGDFPSFQAVVDEIEAYGVCGPVIIEVEDGTYNEQIILNEYTSMNATNTVTFKSQSGNADMVVLMYSSTAVGDNYTINFKNAKYFNLENISIQNLGSSYARAIVLEGSASNINVTNCIITLATTTSTSANLTGIYATNSALFEGITLIGNEINGGAYGLYYRGVSTSSYAGKIIVENNRFLNQYSRGAYFYYVTAPEVRNNYVASDNSTNTSSYGLYFVYASFMQVENNFVDETTDAFYYGLYFSNSNGDPTNYGQISGNRVKSNYYGIYLTTCLFDNIVHNSSVTASSATSGSRTFYLSNGGYSQFYNNIGLNEAGGYALYMVGDPLFVSDHNNLVTTGTNAFYLSSGIADLAAWNTTTGLDANSLEVMNVFADSVTMAVCNDSLNGVGYATGLSLVDFQNDVRDANNPDIGADEFASVNTFTLGNDRVLCDGDTIVLSAYFFDTIVWNGTDTANIFTTTFPSTITVEVSGICGSAVDTVNVSPQQYVALGASDNLCAGEVKTLDSGIPNGVYSWSNGEQTSSIDVDAAGSYAVTVVDANGCVSSDNIVFTQSDTVNLIDSSIVCEGTSIFLDAVIAGTYSWTGGNSTQTLSVTESGTYAVTVTDGFGCVSSDSTVVTKVLSPVASFTYTSLYTGVTFSNTSVNGTSHFWDFGDGETSTLDNPGDHIYNNYNFDTTYNVIIVAINECGTDTNTVQVAVNPVGVEEMEAIESIQLYPNPTSGELNIAIQTNSAADVNIEMIDVSGRVVATPLQSTINGTYNNTLDVSSFSKGIYFVKVTTEGKANVHRIVIQ